MTKETRANLIFLGLFLAITLPGGVILFKKKLDPTIPPSYLPEATRTRLPYNLPMEAGDKERFIPALTGQWVQQQAKEHGFADIATLGGLPVMSDRRRVQLIGTVKRDGGTDVAVLIWDNVAPHTVEAVARRDDVSLPGTVQSMQALALPEDVRKELVYAGFAKPPKIVTWCEISLPGLTQGEKPVGLTLTESGRSSDAVILFTK